MASIKLDKTLAKVFDKASKFRPVVPEIPLDFRLEVDPRGDSYDEALAARVADPLWMLARQWQFREFDGEDAGSPVGVDYRLDGMPVLGYAPGLEPKNADFDAFAAGDLPLEARVEAEPLLAAGAHPKANIEAGQVLARYCANAGRNDIAKAAQKAYPGTLDAPPDPLSDVAGMLWHLLLDGHGIDAVALAADLRANREPDGTLSALPQALVDAGLAIDAARVLEQWLEWMDDFIVEPTDNPAWQPNRLEYAFELAAGEQRRRMRLDAQEYVDGRIDWHDFDIRSGHRNILRDLDAKPLDDPADRESIPTRVQYAGMPATRFWEFEDGQVNFARLQAGPLDLVRMMVAEYALVHGNDWFLVPARVRAGGLYRVQKMQVRDTFGRVTTVQPVSNAAGSDWRLHGLVNAGNGSVDGATLFIPPPLSDTLEGDPLEEVALVRDEMANLAWAIEKRVQGTSGEPLDRALEDQRYSLGQQPTVPSTDASLVYRLMTPVPSHWLPLIPVRDPGSLSLDIRLQRAGMKRFYRIDAAALAAIDGYADFIDRLRNSPEFVTAVPVASNNPANPDVQVFVFHPRGLLLRADPGQPIGKDSLLIEEEEVPRAGIHVERRFNYARTADGRAWLWCGRRKRVGRGEASSGLRFDIGVKPGRR